MKTAAPTQHTSIFFALFLAVMMVLTGCNAGTLSGPDLAPSDDITVQESDYEKKQRYERNEGESYDKKQRYERNEGEDDDD